MRKDLKHNIDKLIVLGKKKGYLTYDEINHFLSDDISSPEDLDIVIEKLGSQKINVLDSEEAKVWEKKYQSGPQTASELPPLDDPVKMYLKQMGQIPLLSREDEVSLAQDIEEKETALRAEVFKTKVAREEFLELRQTGRLIARKRMHEALQPLRGIPLYLTVDLDWR